MLRKQSIFMLVICIVYAIVSFSVVLFFTFNKPVENKTNDVVGGVIDSENGSEMLPGETYDMPSNICFSGNQENVVSLHALGKPAFSKYDQMEWAVAYVDETIAITDDNKLENFVKIKVNDGDSTYAMLTKYKNFDNQIKIVVSSLHDPSIKAECVLDCVGIPDYTINMYSHDKSWEFNIGYGIEDTLDFPFVELNSSTYLFDYGYGSGRDYYALNMLPVNGTIIPTLVSVEYAISISHNSSSYYHNGGLDISTISSVVLKPTWGDIYYGIFGTSIITDVDTKALNSKYSVVEKLASNIYENTSDYVTVFATLHVTLRFTSDYVSYHEYPINVRGRV